MKKRDERPEADPGARLDWGRPGLAAWQRRVAVAVTEAVLADEDEQGQLVPAAPETCARAARWMDDALGRSSSDLRRGFVVLSALIEWLPLFMILAPSRMSRLPLARRIAYLEALESSRIGLLAMLLVAFKVPLSIPAFEEGEELASTGFDRPSTTARRRLPVTMGETPKPPPRALTMEETPKPPLEAAS
jgi:hypothetical protein